MITALASERQFADHIRPVLAHVPGSRLVTDADSRIARGERIDGPVLVASWGDLKRARQLGASRLAFMEHGAGQSYGGEPHNPTPPPRKWCVHCHPSYAGGLDRYDVSLTLVPNDHAAGRWRAQYPDMDVRIVGCPKLDSLPHREGGDAAPVVALSAHFNASIGCPEADSGWWYYRDLVPALAKRFRLIGHGHPRFADRIRPWFERAHVPFVEDFADVCRQADLYATDNSSTLFEFAATGRPVVVINAPQYRRAARHGLRYWEAAHVGVNATPATLAGAIDRALTEDHSAARKDALGIVYAYRSGAAERAADALREWAGVAQAVAA